MDNPLLVSVIPFLVIVATGILVMGISVILRWFWAQVLPIRGLWYFISAPGIVVHEITHIAGCLVTGAKVKKVVLFSSEGGSVTYTSPRIPLAGNVIINTAPLFGIPLVLACLAWLFATYLGCNLVVLIPAPVSLYGAGSLVSTAVTILYQNLIVQFNGWFLLYLYLTVSLVLALSPSLQDIRNAAPGVFILTVLGLLIIAGNIPFAITFVSWMMNLFATGLALGLIFELIALIVTIPVGVIYAIQHGG